MQPQHVMLARGHHHCPVKCHTAASQRQSSHHCLQILIRHHCRHISMRHCHLHLLIRHPCQVVLIRRCRPCPQARPLPCRLQTLLNRCCWICRCCIPGPRVPQQPVGRCRGNLQRRRACRLLGQMVLAQQSHFHLGPMAQSLSKIFLRTCRRRWISSHQLCFPPQAQRRHLLLNQVNSSTHTVYHFSNS